MFQSREELSRCCLAEIWHETGFWRAQSYSRPILKKKSPHSPVQQI